MWLDGLDKMCTRVLQFACCSRSHTAFGSSLKHVEFRAMQARGVSQTLNATKSTNDAGFNKFPNTETEFEAEQDSGY